jgi:3-oxoacyl-[acyl-carrier-protein] synthase-3
MRFENVSLEGLAYVDAPHRVTSADLGLRLAPTLKRLGLWPNLLESVTGIVARRFWEPDTRPSEVAALAAERALERANVDRGRVGVLVSTSVCKDYIEPSVASLVHSRLGLAPECLNFDVGNACLAFLSGMEVAGNMIERGQVDYALIVDGESSRFITERTLERLLDPSCTARTLFDNLATLTLGSGAVAAVLARTALAPDGHRFVGGVSLAATQHSHLCRGQVDEMTTDATTLLNAGLELASRTFARATAQLGWRESDLDEFVLHQVSASHTIKLAEALGLDPAKIHAIYPEYGNIGPAAVPITLAKAEEAGRLERGDRVALMGIGSGLNCSMMEVVW